MSNPSIEHIAPHMKELTPPKINQPAFVFTLVCLVIGAILFMLWKFRPALPCLACENGSWWYKCQENTGAGTKTCKDIIEGQITINEIIQKTEDVAQKFGIIQSKMREPIDAIGSAARNMGKAITGAMQEYNPASIIIKGIDEAGDIIPAIGSSVINVLDELGDVGAVTRAALEQIGFDKLTVDLSKPINAALKQAAAPVKEGLKAGATVIGKGMEAAWKGALSPLEKVTDKLNDEWKGLMNKWRPVSEEIRQMKSEVLDLLHTIRSDISDVMWFAMIRSIQAIVPGLPVIVIMLLVAFVLFMVIAGSIFGSLKFITAPVRMML